MFGSKDLLFSAESYRVAKSLRFRSSATAYLSRIFSAGNRKTWTWSGWVKRGSPAGVAQWLFDADNGSTDSTELNFAFASTDALVIAGSVTQWRVTTQVFRDYSSWYHIVAAIDTTQATANNRIRLYVNGAEITTFSTLNNPSPSADLAVNQAITHYLGIRTGLTSPLDGYLAEVNFIDGQALTPSSFGFYDNNGIWQPKGYTGTYGTNGFYLKFTDVGATSGANTGYGKDFSGFNTNYWTTNNFGTTSTATTYDSMYDSPVNASNGITGIGNYAVLNPLDVSSTILTLSNGNLTATQPSTGTSRNAFGNMLVSSGKWYFEATVSTTNNVGTNIGISDTSTATSYYAGYRKNGGTFGLTASPTFSAYVSGDIIGVAFDMDASTISFYVNNTLQGTGNYAFANGGTRLMSLRAAIDSADTTGAWNVNFGQRPFAYTPPSGYSALNTQNLTTPTITNGASYMAAVLYTGTGSSQTITASSTNSGNNPNGTTFQPDFVWAKGRSGATDHALYDAVRGVQLQLESNTTGAETTETTGLTAFTGSGFTTGALAQMNTNTATYVAWEWNAGGSNATNTSGSITSTVRANTSAGFSIVTYTGTGANATVGHGLGVAPSMIIVKNRSTAGDDWTVYHISIGATNRIILNLTNASSASTVWNNTAPTSTVFSVGTVGDTNRSGSTLVAYCFAPVAGYSAFGSYTGNGSADGPFVYCGFRPRWVIVKATTAISGNWVVIDTSRLTYNQNGTAVYANLSNSEITTAYIDFLSNGFKIRNNSTNMNNTSSDTYIWAAFAENPFKISRAM